MLQRLVFALLPMLSWASVADAALLGATVRLTARYPSVDAVFLDPGNVVVTNAVEFPRASLWSYSPYTQVDIGDDYIEFWHASLDPGSVSGADFNGYVLEVLSGREIVSATPEDTSGYFPKTLWIEDGRLYLDYANTEKPADSRSRIRLVTAVAVPEPATWLMMIAGLGVTGAALRRRRSPAVTR